MPRVGGRRATVAVYLDYMTFFSGMYEERLRSLFHAKCQELDLDLLLVYGRELRSDDALTGHHNRIFELARSERVDAIAIVSTSLSARCGVAGIAELAARCEGKPVCSIGVALPGVPSVTVDDRAGVTAAVEHLIREHGLRRIAFIGGPRGNVEAEARLQAYRDVLAAHGIAPAPDLIGHGDFVRAGGRRAMQELLVRGIVPEAVVAANDAMALGAMEVLQRHGRRVPHDVAVTGFDNVPAGSVGNPSLTTVAQPFAAVVDLALGALREQLEGRPVPELVCLPGEFIARRSCGCSLLRHKMSPGIVAPAGVRLLDYLREQAGPLQLALANVLRVGGDDGSATAARLLQGIELELQGSQRAFVSAVEDFLEEVADDAERYAAMQGGITFLRETFGRSTELEELWHEARTVLALASSTSEFRHRFKLENMNLHMLAVGERLLSAWDFGTLRSVLPGSLSAMGIRTAFISRYPEAGSAELEPLVCLVNGEPPSGDLEPFSERLLYPDVGDGAAQRRTYLVFPLVSETRMLGVLVLQYASSIEGYPMLRDQIAATLRTIELHLEVVEKTREHERSIQERVAATKRMQGLTVLAGSVAHDLNNSLGPLVALPEMILRELDELPVESDALANTRADLDTMKNAALRAIATIKDLLTLSRQGKAAQRALDLNRTILACFTDSALRLITRDAVQVAIEVTPEPLIVRGAESQLVRAMLNLVRNAVEASGSAGQVTVRTFAVSFSERSSGYEQIEPGDYVGVAVSDQGQGIPDHDLSHIFEPFFSTKHGGESSGTGLGLAITHAVVKEHRGFVDVVTKLGGGTTFVLYFPRAEGHARITERPAARPGRARVLIVDDDAVQLRTGRRLLTHLGYAVDTLNRGGEAYERFLRASPAEQSPYDIVLLDVLLNEEHDGIHLLEQILTLFPAQKAILVSGHAPPERTRLAAEKRLFWLAKPYTLETLAHAVERALAGDPPSSGSMLVAMRRDSVPVPAP